MFVGLVHDPGTTRPEPPAADPPPHRRALPWRAFAWVTGWVGVLLLAGQVGGFAGYLGVLLAVAVGSWRLERWCARQPWGGLDEYHRVG